MAEVSEKSDDGDEDKDETEDEDETGDASKDETKDETEGETKGETEDASKDETKDETSTAENEIDDRMFFMDAHSTAGMVSSYLSGLHGEGVLGCPKAFPGIAGSDEATEKEHAITEKDWGDIKDENLEPFSRAIDEEVKFIMVSHLGMPEVTGDEIPASLSGIILTEKLRLDLGFSGIIITDDMNKGAITESMDSGEAAIAAVKAGADMILLPEDFKSAYDAVLTGISDGTISEQRIAESARRIIWVKLFLEENG